MTNLVSNFKKKIPILNSDLKEVQFTKNISFDLRHPYNTLKVPKCQNLATVKKDNNNKHSKFDAKFVLQHPVRIDMIRT